MPVREIGSSEDREHIFEKFIFEEKSLLWTFFYWLLLRSFGGHFIYLERYWEALFYFVFITLFLAVPIAIYGSPYAIAFMVVFRVGELVYLPFLVKNSNALHKRKLREEFGLESKP